MTEHVTAPPVPAWDGSDLDGLGLARKETLDQDAMLKLITDGTRDTYGHDEMFGEYCSISTHVDVPYDVVFDYCADTRSLGEWTYSIRGLTDLGDGLYRARDGIQPNTEIFVRTVAHKNPEHGVVLYECAWDQGHELWMRYYLTIIDSMKVLAKPGTVISWTNCKHPYYDRATTDVPDYIEAGRARTDRLWVGDIWPMFHAAHSIEIDNLTKIVKHRYERR
jgi:hypothetical protein